MSNKKIAIIIGSIFFILGLITLPHYNINWDATNHLTRGQAYLHYFLTGKIDYSDLAPWKKYWQKPSSLFFDPDIPKSEVSQRSVYQQDGTPYYDLVIKDGYGHPPLSDILSSFFNVVLFQKLRILNDIDSYRVYGLLLASSLVALVYFWTAKKYGGFAGVVSALSLSLYPLFLAHSHFNTEKDIPEVVYISFFLFSFWKGIISKSWRWIIVSAIFFGLGLGTKLNILFSVFVVLPWVAYLFITKYFRRKDFWFIASIFLIPIVGVLILVISWPYLWADPVSGLVRMLTFYKEIGTASEAPKLLPIGPINTYAIQTVLFTTPIPTLFLSFVGIFFAVKNLKREKDKSGVLFIFWLLVPIIRVSLPGTNIYGGVRQIMEFIPAMAILAGIGAYSLRNQILKKVSLGKKAISIFIIILFFLPISITLYKMHPSEEFYFNFLIGGLNGAEVRNFPSWAENYGSPYRQAVTWIDNNAPLESKVVLAYELMPNIPSLFFRSDINFFNTQRSGYLRNGEYAITLVSQRVSSRSYYDMYLEKFLNPVFKSSVDGVDIIRVWKNDQEHLKGPWKEELEAHAAYKVTNLGITIDIGQTREISRLEIDYVDGDCSRMTYGLVQISEDYKNWIRLPGDLPEDWRISSMGEQPKNGKFIEPFVGQSARYIDLTLTPKNTCLKRVKNVRVYYFE